MKRILPIILIMAILLSWLGANTAAYSDVSAGDWYYDAVDFVTSAGLYNGTSETTFSPGVTMNRGMFVTVLGRLAGVSAAVPAPDSGVVTKDGVNLRSAPNTGSTVLAVLNRGDSVTINSLTGEWYSVKYKTLSGYIRSDLMSPANMTKFTDVESEAYYLPYVIWASGRGLVSGTSETLFSPSAPITRELICLALYNYAKSANYRLPNSVGRFTFTDDYRISASAKEAVYAMQQCGVVSGRTEGDFDPQAGATRAEVAAMFMRFVNAIAYKPEAAPAFAPDGGYVYGTALPESAAVTDGYFDDACFIGHSFVVGMSMYFNLPNADYYAVSGISASGVLKYENYTLPLGYEDEEGNTVYEKGSLNQALSQKRYKKVYIMLGTNELGSSEANANAYYANMCALVDLVRGTQPGAIIYVLAAAPVSRSVSESSANFNRDNAIIYNLRLKQLSMEKHVVYLDTFTLFCSTQGFLRPDADMSDGIHISAAQYAVLKNFLKTHTFAG